MIQTTLLSIFKKLVVWDKKLEIYKNGEDNAYPERMERYINNSVTAKMASNTMVQYLLGKGFGEADNLKINGLKLIDIADDIAQDLVENRGVFIHVNYNANFEVSSFKSLVFGNCRVGEKDSKDYNGKILIHKDWSGKVDKSDVKILDVYNPNAKIVASQIEKAGGIEKYKGQVFFYNMDNKYYYPLSRVDAVVMECDNEYQASVYKNTILREGWFGNTLVVTRPLTSGEEITEHDDAETIRHKKLEQSERKAFKDGLSKFMGAGGSGGVMHLEMDFAGEKLEDAILFKNIENNINPDMFKITENTATEKILMAFNNLPISLVKASEGLFSNSGDALNVAKQSYWENTNKERNLLETILNDFLLRMSIPYAKIQPLLTTEVDVDSATQEKQKAQAQLKGSVGGVQGVLAIQASVSQGLTNYESAITILNEIYGIEDSLARSILGTPKTETNATN